MWTSRLIAIALLTVLVASPVAMADPEDCRVAIDQYNSARTDVFYALKGYSQCVSGSDGHDDCSGEFSRLRAAQSDFESAVSEYESECN
ncbi:MAG TPA: hypothetical protein VGB82_12110 [Alphaproteobacteria bacterium]